MKFFLQVMLVMVLAFVLELFLPWWAIAIAAALTGLFAGGKVSRSFFAGFIGVFLLWFVSALMLQFETRSELPQMVGQLLPGKPDAGGVMLIAGVIGGLVGGFACAGGDSLRAIFTKSKAA